MTDMNYLSMPATLGGFVVLFVLVGCAAGFDRGGVSEAALAGNTEAMWKDGQQAVVRGEALIAKGEKRLAQGYKKIRNGEAAISQGNRKVAQARQEYQAAAAAAGASSTPVEVDYEAKRLGVIGDRWQEAITEIRKGNELVGKGNNEVSTAQSEIREGRALLESGSTLMRNAQRARLGDKPLPSPAQKNES